MRGPSTVKMTCTDISDQQRRSLPGPALSFAIGDVFEVENLKTHAVAAAESSALGDAAPPTPTQYFSTRNFPALWLPTSCCTVLREGDGFTKGDTVIVKGIGRAKLQRRNPAGPGWVVEYEQKSFSASKPKGPTTVAADQFVAPGAVRPPRPFRVRGEMCKGQSKEATFEVRAYEHTKIPELYIFAVFFEKKWHLTGVSLASIRSKPDFPRVVDHKSADGREETLRKIEITPTVASQLWDGVHIQCTTRESHRPFSIRHVIVEAGDPSAPEFPSQWVVCYDHVVLRKGPTLDTAVVMTSDTSSSKDMDMGTVLTVDKTEILAGGHNIRMHVTSPVEGWITQVLSRTTAR